MRSWCFETFAREGVEFKPVQANVSVTFRKGTVRGMHFQREPRPDAKLVRVTQGRIQDVVVDLRPGSALRGRWFSTELSAHGNMLFVPVGFAHGFQTLTDDVTVEYLMGEIYVPELYDGFRYDDPAIGIGWPLPVVEISDKDLSWSPLAPRMPGFTSPEAHAPFLGGGL
jgi:dTDP-4-dehydrorhamnose 3,5-epimerase